MKKVVFFILVILILLLLALRYRPTSDTSSFGTFIQNLRVKVNMPAASEQAAPTDDSIAEEVAPAPTPAPSPDEPAPADDTVNVQSQGYVEFNDATVREALTQGKQVVLFFHADRCPVCRALEADITSEDTTLPDNVVIFKVNYDTETDLKTRYNVTSQSTLVYLDENMEAKNTVQGVTDTDDVLAGFSS